MSNEESRQRVIVDQCHSDPLNDLISLEGDYLVLVGMKDFLDELPAERDKIISEIKTKHGIKNNTCAAAILGYVKNKICLSGDTDYVFYEGVCDGTKNWSESTIRRNIRRLEKLGVFHRTNFKELDKIYSDDLSKRVREFFGIFHSDIFFKDVLVLDVHLPEYIQHPPAPGDRIIVTELRTVREDRDVKLEKSEGIVEKVDLRKLTDEEKRKIVSKFIHLAYLGPKQSQTYNASHEQRVAALNQTVAKAGKLPHVLQLYSVGSFANNDEKGTSDVDVLVVTQRCPGYEKCGVMLKNHLIDLFCFTEGEFREAYKKKLAILIGAQKIYEKSKI